MKTPEMVNVTRLLVAWSGGDEAALERLAPLVYDELHRVASRHMAGERPGHLLQSTALVNEVYIRLIEWKTSRWQNRAHFFSVAAAMMRRILVDDARTRRRAKRGADAVQVALSDVADLPSLRSRDLLLLDDALTALERLNPRESRVVELRFFGGLTLEEVAEVLKVSVGTVRRDWTFAQAWLFRELNGTRHP